MVVGRRQGYVFPQQKKRINNTLFIVVAVILVVIIFFTISTYSDSQNPLKPQIAIVPIKGEISAEESGGFLASDVAKSEDIITQLEQASKDHNVKAVILEINSPGGSVVATREIATAIDRFEKPIISWMRESATSGAYWIAASTDVIVADPATVTGSIGVTSSFLEFSGLMSQYGVDYERLVSGPYKDTGTPYRDLTPNERSMLQNKIDIINEMFIRQIKANRNMTDSRARQLATGEIFLGTEAKSIGLIDVLGGKEEAITIAERKADISDSQIIVYKKKESVLAELLKFIGQSSYSVGRGIGDSWNPITSSDKIIKISV